MPWTAFGGWNNNKHSASGQGSWCGTLGLNIYFTLTRTNTGTEWNIGLK